MSAPPPTPTPPVRVEFVLTVLAFNGTFAPRKSICLPESCAASCQTRKDWLPVIKACATYLRGPPLPPPPPLLHCNYPHHGNGVLCGHVEPWDSSDFFSSALGNFWSPAGRCLQVRNVGTLWLAGWSQGMRFAKQIASCPCKLDFISIHRFVLFIWGIFLAKSGLIPHQNSQVLNILQKLFRKHRVSRRHASFQGVKSHNWMSQLLEVAVGSRTLAAERDVLS